MLCGMYHMCITSELLEVQKSSYYFKYNFGEKWGRYEPEGAKAQVKITYHKISN